MIGRKAELLPPEGVPIAFEISSAGSRLGAQLLDILITFGGMFLLFVVLIWMGVFDWGLLATLFFLLTFLIRIPYYIFAELVWNGRTIGKRIVKIRVVSDNGGRLTPHQIVARNLMKEVEVFLPIATLLSGQFDTSLTGWMLFFWMVGILLVPLLNKHRQRLGDMIAGTLVVDQPQLVLMPDLSTRSATKGNGFVFDTGQLGVYGRYELQVLEEILRSRPQSLEQTKRMQEVARTIVRKIGYQQRLLPNDYWNFLNDFYRQQREFLENRHLFGDTRENKFHDVKAAGKET
ncbi:RDD family protein [Roseovarius albus]|uniref:RDD family protein n=1 Tax=Roseovarius albus TaxID=1247867 RepID=A0A1X6ZN95_9RHOB|nr:RDD family protein [Roseovarius albus]SLN56257.1 RDD family protein [Roseovarius albus]